MNLATMTRVQQLSIPVVLREKDVLIKSQTGSGEIVPDTVETVVCLCRELTRTHLLVKLS